MGFYLGPSATPADNYASAIKKAKTRVPKWRATRCAMLDRIKVYNTFIATLTSYVEQLVVQPKEVTQAMYASMRTIVGGVCGWTTPQTLPYLKTNFNFPLATRMPEAYNLAAAFGLCCRGTNGITSSRSSPAADGELP